MLLSEIVDLDNCKDLYGFGYKEEDIDAGIYANIDKLSVKEYLIYRILSEIKCIKITTNEIFINQL